YFRKDRKPMVSTSSYAPVPVDESPLHEKILTAILRNIDRNPDRVAYTIICVRQPRSARVLPKGVVPWDDVVGSAVTAIPKYNYRNVLM
ncbi:hypothetical protein OESDEN_09716, partial [Oesophagostomum dentatum]